MKVNPLGLIPILDERIRIMKGDRPSIIALSFGFGALLGLGIAIYLAYLQRMAG